MVAYDDESRVMADVVAREYTEKYPENAPFRVYLEQVTHEFDPRGE